MEYVAFLRNVNLGQRGAPTRAQLEAAFLEAGAARASSFLSNGTLVFSRARHLHSDLVVQCAGRLLRERHGLREPLFCRGLDRLSALVEEDPFGRCGMPPDGMPYLSLFDPTGALHAAVPIESARRDCTVFRIDKGEAFSHAQRVGGRSGYPTALLESVLRVPVTTRGWATIVRLVESCPCSGRRSR